MNDIFVSKCAADELIGLGEADRPLLLIKNIVIYHHTHLLAPHLHT